VVALGVALVLTQLGSGPTAKRAAIVHHPPARGARHRPATSGAKTTHSASASTSATTSTNAASSTTPAGSSSSGNSAGGSALQLQGHQELVNGNYTAAIPILERAVSASSPSDLSYAYALYDLGDALLRSGNAKAAVPILEQRLRIPNQTATVQALLNQALQAAGQPVPPSNTGGAPVPAGHDHGHGQGKPGKGGD
jgi:predicted Zn-dependent protease